MFYNPNNPRSGISFHPYQWAENLLDLCKASSSPKYKKKSFKLASELLKKGSSFLKQQNTSTYYLYPFSFNLYGIEIEKNWVSGLSQAYALSAFSCLCEKTGDDRYCQNATNTFRSYFDIKDFDKKNNALWFTNIDKHQFLWFQEVPQNRKKQFNILNGHLASIAGLYSYYRSTKSPEALLLMRAGIATVKRYLLDFRSPNSTASYFLYDTNVADYSPARTIMELKWLSAITGDDYFKNIGNLFAADSQITTNEALLERY